MVVSKNNNQDEKKEIQHVTPRAGRKMKSPGCSHKLIDKPTERSFLCATIPEETRAQIFNHFWKKLKTWGEKKIFLEGIIIPRNVLKRRKNTLKEKIVTVVDEQQVDEVTDIQQLDEVNASQQQLDEVNAAQQQQQQLNDVIDVQQQFADVSDGRQQKLDSVTNARNENRKRKTHSEKQLGFDILIYNTDTGDRVKVCQQFLVNTLDVGKNTIKNWMNDNEVTISKRHSLVHENQNQEDNNLNTNEVAKVTQRSRDSAERKGTVKQWLKLLPKVPSHYCRSTSKKTYVESTFRSESHMYNIFKEWCTEDNKKSVGRSLFLDIIKSENVAIHHSRKDQCDTCTMFKLGSVSAEEYANHIRKKDEARAAKNAAKSSASKTKLVLTMDLQSVLLAPKTLASSMYYKQKLQIHNFTIYELNTGDVHLYVWNEVEGGVTANEFASCIVDYLKSRISTDYKEIILISDGCCYQNRNKCLTSALSRLSQERGIEIQQMYLEKGHTMMETDSVHSTLEHYFSPPINSPSDYVARMRTARPKHPYAIIPVDHDFFLDYQSICGNFESIRPGKNYGESVNTDIRSLQYLPTGEVNYRLNYSSEWSLLVKRTPTPDGELVPSPTSLYNNRIPISDSKFKQLQELKPVIEKEHHYFYDNLPRLAPVIRSETRKGEPSRPKSLSARSKSHQVKVSTLKPESASSKSRQVEPSTLKPESASSSKSRQVKKS